MLALSANHTVIIFPSMLSGISLCRRSGQERIKSTLLTSANRRIGILSLSFMWMCELHTWSVISRLTFLHAHACQSQD